MAGAQDNLLRNSAVAVLAYGQTTGRSVGYVEHRRSSLRCGSRRRSDH